MRRLLAVVAAAGASLGLVACSGGSHHAAKPPSASTVATVRTADCTMWRRLRVQQRWVLVRGMRDFFGGQVDSPGARGQVLPDRNAYRLFTQYCRQPYASEFHLYRLYGNAAAFTQPKK